MIRYIIKELVKITIHKLNKVKFNIGDDVFEIMNKYIKLLLKLKSKLHNKFDKTQKKLYINLFNSIDNCIDISKKQFDKNSIITII